MNGSWDAYLAFPADFGLADDFITNLAKRRESLGWNERTPSSLIITSKRIFELNDENIRRFMIDTTFDQVIGN